MIPYTAKFYANGTIYDSVGMSSEKYLALYREGDVVYYLREKNQVDSYNVFTEEIKQHVAWTSGTHYGELPPELITEPGAPLSGIVSTVDATSIVVVDGHPYGFQGYNAKPFDADHAMYITDANTLVVERYDFTSKHVLLSSQSHIRDFFIDENSNYFVIHGKQSITKFNKERILQFTTKMSELSTAFFSIGVSLSSEPEFLAIDKVREYTNIGLKQYPVVLGRLNTSQMFMSRVDDATGVLINTKLIPASGTFYPHGDVKHVNYNLTNFSHLQRKYKNRETELLFKLTLKNIYNNRQVVQVEIPVDTSKYTTGYHHFVFRLNTARGEVSLFVDGRRFKTVAIPSTNWTFQDITQDSMAVGTTYFYNNIPLFMKLKQPNYYMANNCKIKQFKIFDKAVTDDEIRLLTYNNTKIGDLMISLPCGQRNELEQIERIFSFNVPGNKSNYINVIVKNTNITNTVLQERVREVLTEKLKKVLPVATTINSITFKDTKLTFNKHLSG